MIFLHIHVQSAFWGTFLSAAPSITTMHIIKACLMQFNPSETKSLEVPENGFVFEENVQTEVKMKNRNFYKALLLADEGLTDDLIKRTALNNALKEE